MLTGALASSYYGRPRTTLDIDIVVRAKRGDLKRLAKALTNAKLKVEEGKLETAWKSKYRIVTVEDRASPHTVDIILTDAKLERKAGLILGLPTFFQTPESLILTKPRMVKASLQPERAETDRQDIRAILESTKLRLNALRKRAKAQGTSEILEELLRE